MPLPLLLRHYLHWLLQNVQVGLQVEVYSVEPLVSALMAGAAVLPLVLLEQAEVRQALVVADALAQEQRLRLHQLDASLAPVLHRSPLRSHH